MGEAVYLVLTMAGSLRNYLYTTDSNKNYYMGVDLSNAGAVNNTVLADATLDRVPGNIRKRTLKYVSADRLSVIKIPVSTRALFDAAPPAVNNYRGVQCFLVGGSSERRHVPALSDTGLTNP
jgi:hypothetical protein